MEMFNRNLLNTLVFITTLYCVNSNFAQAATKAIMLFQVGKYEEAYQEYIALTASNKLIDKLNGLEGLGQLYQQGLGVEKDTRRALKFYLKGIDVANKVFKEKSCCARQGMLADKIGRIYFTGGPELKRDYPLALKYLRISAKHSPSYYKGQAEFYIGYMYANGLGVKKSMRDTINWYRYSSAKGNASAKNNLGVIYENGMSVKVNDKEALRYYKESWELGNMQAKGNYSNLAKRYEEELLK